MSHNSNMYLLCYCCATDGRSPESIAITAFDGFVTDVTPKLQIPMLHNKAAVAPLFAAVRRCVRISQRARGNTRGGEHAEFAPLWGSDGEAEV